jgi:hypothetical protein
MQVPADIFTHFILTYLYAKADVSGMRKKTSWHLKLELEQAHGPLKNERACSGAFTQRRIAAQQQRIVKKYSTSVPFRRAACNRSVILQNIARHLFVSILYNTYE